MENSGVTSETAFAQSYSSTWRLLAPATDLFVRKVNTMYREREFAPVESIVAPERRGFINEVAFELFRSRRAWFRNLGQAKRVLVSEAVELARITISRIERMQPSDIVVPSDAEEAEIDLLAERLQLFFSRVSEREGLEVQPRFPGCGIIDTCFGDIRFGDALYEVKAGDRNFRSVDVRQLMIYAALCKSARLQPLRRMGLFNPRTGFSFCISLDELCLEVSGTSSEELLAEIIRVISSGDTSR
jgi:hypothetical protein